ncbi:hypothetical protein SAMN04490243_2352 [Robiginitalea myxolifaciens]|uniref:Uncharacterized protein n=1 Tax=Robiginitalea myxolifaciens TaxID=400055 RepID=A0A1I6H6Y7_9FLAO|nr:hypothetical protein [Robiginitalea myxolifaciens]SFR50209.1 hypothetical protein SAMN04490243_2352 [Robiginitalea myxolifaciens]
MKAGLSIVPEAWRRFSFNLRAKNRHGTHSPFIYEFLDKSLYAGPRTGNPELRLKQAAEPYFTSLGHTFLNWEDSATQLKAWLEDQQMQREKVVLYWDGIRSSSENYEDWKEIQAHPNIGQILETYGAALLFFRTNQVREHFKIRL